MIYVNQFFLNISKYFRKFYFNSKIYDKRISKTNFQNISYKPSPHLLSSLIKYQKKNLKLRTFH